MITITDAKKLYEKYENEIKYAKNRVEKWCAEGNLDKYLEDSKLIDAVEERMDVLTTFTGFDEDTPFNCWTFKDFIIYVDEELERILRQTKEAKDTDNLELWVTTQVELRELTNFKKTVFKHLVLEKHMDNEEK